MTRPAFVTLRRGSVEEPIFCELKNADGVQPEPTALSSRQTEYLKRLYLDPGSSDVTAWADEVCNGAGEAYRRHGPFKFRVVSTAINLDLSLDVNAKTSLNALTSWFEDPAPSSSITWRTWIPLPRGSPDEARIRSPNLSKHAVIASRSASACSTSRPTSKAPCILRGTARKSELTARSSAANANLGTFPASAGGGSDV